MALVFLMASLGCIEENKPTTTPTPTETTPAPKEETKITIVQQQIVPPQSLDQYYRDQPVFLFKMFELGGAMMAFVANIQQNDADNVKTSFDTFSHLYEDASNLVPEWNKYYNIDAVNRLGEAVERGDPGEIFPALDEVGKTCSTCHRIEKPSVWAKYYWKDFRTITMETGNPQEPVLPFVLAKMRYLAPAFDGTIANIREKQQKNATDSLTQFSTEFSNLEKTCLSCHNTPRYYFVSQDVKSLISKAKQQIATEDLEGAEKTLQQIGMESCYKCHIIHEPAQRIKESLEK